jgi:hypothetical protein
MAQLHTSLPILSTWDVNTFLNERYTKENHADWSAKIWQNRYFERVVRIDQLERTRRYLQDNPGIPDTLYTHMGWTKNHP